MYTVGVIMGSKSDYEVMEGAIKTLEQFGIACDKRVISAHRAPEALACLLYTSPSPRD